ncbi:MAG: glycosyltransferase family 4 protein [Bacteriovorax sp.]|nr:glycosyltransferase family 4 protein [Bacteriovorax sp.]
MKLLIVRSSEASTWGSCKVISPNLQDTYKLLPENIELSWFDIPIKYIQKEINSERLIINELANKIKTESPDQIIFIDHLPCPADILIKLSLIMELRQLPPLVFHIYGDFTYFSKDWLDLSSKIVNHPLKFITASSSQKKLLGFFCEDSSTIDQLCFPVNSEDYSFNSTDRREFRNKHNINEGDTVILYAGRVSLQKNVDILIQEYLNLIKNENSTVHLWVVGAFDDMGAPFMGVKTRDGYLYSKIQTILGHHPKGFTRNIKFWGRQDKDELKKIKAASDMFISLSLYHDEDYGMSPAEAMACGLPTLLTDWGGYSSFASKAWRCQLIPVKITEFGLQIKTTAISEFYEALNESYINDIDRERWSKEFLNAFSIKNTVSKLEKIMTTPFNVFTGFNWALAPFTQIYGKTAKVNTIDANTCPSNKNFYFQVYQNYISQNNSGKDHE